MKKAKVFIAALLTSGLVLTGCTFEEGLEKAKSFASEKIAQPVVNFWNEKILGKKAQEPEKEKEEKQDEGDKPAPAAEAKLLSISISGQYKSEYEVGESFDPTGIIVTAAYDDESTKDVSSQAQFSGFDSSQAGQCTVTASFEGQTASIQLTINPAVKRDWTDEEKALFAEHLHNIDIPFFPVEGATPVYEASEDRVRIFDGQGEALQVSGQEIPDYAALFSAADGWDDVSSDYGAYANAPAGSFWVFEKSTQTSEGMRRISVQFFGHNGSSYSLAGDFYFFASDPFSYEFPADLIASEFDYYNMDAFTLPAPDAENMYFEFYPDSNNDLYYAYGYEDYMNATIYFYGFTSESFAAYKAKLEAEGWVFEGTEYSGGIMVYNGKLEFNDGSFAIIEQFYFTESYSALTYDYLIAEPSAWPTDAAAALVEKFAPGSTTVIPECPGGDSYDSYMNSYYNEIDVDGDESLKDTYAGILRTAGWTETEEGSYIFISPNQDIQLTLVFTSYGLEIRVASYIPPAAEWPAEDAAKLLPEGGQDTLPPYEGANSYQYYNDAYGAGVSCFVGEGNEDDAMAAYAELLIAAKFTLEGGYYISEHNEFKVELWKGTDGAFNIEVSIIPHWPTADVAEGIAGLDSDVTITDLVPALEGADAYAVYPSETKVQVQASYSSSTALNNAKSEFVSLLTTAGYKDAGQDEFGDTYYNSPNDQISVCPWLSSSGYRLIIDIFPGAFEAPAGGWPTADIASALLAIDPNITDALPAWNDNSVVWGVDASSYAIQVYANMGSSSAAATAVTTYQGLLTTALYTEAGADSYGDMHYTSPNGQLDVCAWSSGAYLVIDVEPL